ncbi:MAG: hypothetical protein ABIU54_00110, partial [Candidatus Eisenbacteria bacterium]
REARRARADEDRRVRECGEVIRYFANHHGHVARLAVDRGELRDWIASGAAPQELATFLADRCQGIEGPLLGHQLGAGAELPVRLPEAMRTRHLYLVGRSGSGKTTLIRNLVLHDLRAGHGLAVVAPEAELIEQEILPFIPARRIEDVVYVNPADTQAPVPLNPLHLEEGEDLDLKVAETLSILRRLFDEDGGGGAPRMETILRQALYALTQVPGSTLLDLEPLLDRQDDAFRRRILMQVPDEESRQFWSAVYPGYPKDAHLSILNRMGRLLRPKVVRSLLCAPSGSLDIRRAMDEGKVLLFNLSDGLLGEQNAQLLGQLVVAKIQLAAMRRASAPKESRRPFYLYVDEFQAFCGAAGSSYEKILSRSRKYGLGLILAHQQTGQIPPSVLREILGNVSSVLAFNVGAADARRLGRELIGERDGEPVPTTPEALLSLRVGEAVCKIGRSVLTLQTLPAIEDGSEAVRDAVVASSRAQYGVTRLPRVKAASRAGSMLDGLDPSEVFGA